MSPRDISSLYHTMFSNIEEAGTRAASIVPIFFIGEVIDHKDPLYKRRIRVRLPVIDDVLSSDTIPWCNPILPEHIHMIPEEGDRVIIILQTPWDYQTGRFYFGKVLDW
jgi:hypothetical protein